MNEEKLPPNECLCINKIKRIMIMHLFLIIFINITLISTNLTTIGTVHYDIKEINDISSNNTNALKYKIINVAKSLPLSSLDTFIAKFKHLGYSVLVNDGNTLNKETGVDIHYENDEKKVTYCQLAKNYDNTLDEEKSVSEDTPKVEIVKKAFKGQKPKHLKKRKLF